MYCKKLRCTVTKETCLSRLKRAQTYADGGKNKFTPHNYDCYLSCYNCKFGRSIFHPEKAEPKFCSVTGCAREVYAKGLCAAHYQRKYNHVEEGAPIQSKRGIDWKDIMTGYNRQKGTKYRSLTSFAKNVYHENTLEEVGKEIGVSKDAFRVLLVKLGVKRHERQWRNTKPKELPKTKTVEIWEKPLCSVCHRWAVKTMGMCAHCYRISRKGISK